MTEPLEKMPSEAAPNLPPAPPRRSLIRRVGCGIALVLWFTLLLAPCGLIVMATQGEIAIPQGSLPGQTIRVWLINEADERGLGTASTSIYQPDNLNTICLQTDSRFLLWYGRPEPSVSYCECFTRATSSAEWGFLSVSEGVCNSESVIAGERMP
jgi:hypothetical protein